MAIATRRSPVTPAPAPEVKPPPAPEVKPEVKPESKRTEYPGGSAGFDLDLDTLAYNVVNFPKQNGAASYPLIVAAALAQSDLCKRITGADHTWSRRCSDNTTRNPAALVSWLTRENLNAKARTADIKVRAAAHKSRLPK